MIPKPLSPDSSPRDLDRERLLKELRSNVQGDIFESYPDRLRFAHDESIFTQTPSIVVAPKGEADLQILVAVAQFFSVPITARGGGTGVAGQSIGSGMLIDFAPYLHEIEEIKSETAVVQPGIVLQKLNAELAKHGRRFAPDPGSRLSCTLGGMVGTNAAGPRSLLHGCTRDHVKRLRVVLADGAVMESSALARRFPTLHGKIAAQRGLVLASHPRTRKNSSGYPLEELLSDPPDYARFLTGTEGTLALTSKIEVRTIPVPPSTTLVIFPFPSIERAAEAVAELRGFRPAAIELVDRYLLEALRKANSAILFALGLDEAEASLWVEWEGAVPVGVDLKGAYTIQDPEGQSNLWALRSKASKLLHETSGRRKPLRCIEDGIVPPECFVEFVTGMREILRRHDCDGAIFGHAGDAHLHVNPAIDVEAPHLPERIDRLMEETYAFILELGGSISGEHGDGVLRRRFAEKQWEKVLPLFHLVKEVFDPAGIFNPDKKLSLGSSLLPPYRNFLEIGVTAPPEAGEVRPREVNIS